MRYIDSTDKKNIYKKTRITKYMKYYTLKIIY